MFHWLAAKNLNHLVAVDRPVLLEPLPLGGSLVDAHIFHGEGANLKYSGTTLRLLLPLNILTMLALDIVVLGFIWRAWMAMKLDQSLSGEVDPVLTVVDTDPTAAQSFGGFGGCAAPDKSIKDNPARRARCRDDSIEVEPVASELDSLGARPIDRRLDRCR
jgi:hypothetical protein